MRTAPALLISSLLVLALAGCVPDAEPVVPKPEPSASPIFASDEEALAAAEEALGAYFQVLDTIGAEGGANPERLSEVATQDVIDHESAGFSELSKSGSSTVGARMFDSVVLQAADLSGNSTQNAVTIYACEDFSLTDVVNGSGESIASSGRQLRWPLVVSFDLNRSTGSLIVSNVDDWTGDDFCTGE